ALGRALALIDAVDHAVAVGVGRTAVHIDARAMDRVRAAVALVGGAGAVGIAGVTAERERDAAAGDQVVQVHIADSRPAVRLGIDAARLHAEADRVAQPQ